MIISNDEKQKILKVFTNVLICIKGKGPQNIYVKYDEFEIRFVVQGILSVYEKYLLSYQNMDIYLTLKNLYLNDAQNVINRFSKELNEIQTFEYKELIVDLDNDYFEYRIIKRDV